MFGTRSAQPIWASGHDDRTTKAGHMTAIDQSNRVADTLRAGGRPHMKMRRRLADDAAVPALAREMIDVLAAQLDAVEPS